MLHLEAGTCSSGSNLRIINSFAHQCYQHQHYTTDDDHYQYKCPECGARFLFMSGLFQHVESESCQQGYDGSIEKVKNYLRRSVWEMDFDSD